MRSSIRLAAVVLASFVFSLHASAQESWHRIQTPIAGALNGVDVPEPGSVVVVGESGAIARSSDGGESWTVQTPDNTPNLSAVRFWSPDSGVAVGNEGTILTTYDAGRTWTPRESGLTKTSQRFLFGITFTDNRIIAVGGEGDSYSSAILTSTDRGRTWRKQLLRSSLFLDRIAFADSLTALTVGMDLATAGGGIWRTTDGGVTWKNVHLAPQLIISIHFTGNTAIAVGSGGMIYSSSDRGASWESFEAAEGADLLDIVFDSRGVGIIVGDRGVALVSIDAGATWTQLSVGSQDFLNDAAIDTVRSMVYAVGLDGGLYRSEIVSSAGVGDDPGPEDRIDLRIDGDELVIGHDVAGGNDCREIMVYDIAGRAVAGRGSDPSGTRIRLPGAGFYLVVCRNRHGVPVYLRRVVVR